jgi:glucose-1-phosphate thymidylyltransferase
MKAVLLAAGFATRLHPLTLERAKPLLDVGGRPVLTRLLERVLELPGLDEVAVVANRRFSRQFQAWADGLDTPVPLRLIDDGALDDAHRLGAIGDLALALEQLPDDGAPLFVGAGDNLVETDLASYARRFAAEPTRPLLIVRRIEGEVPPGRYSEVVLGPDSLVTSFREKPADPRSPLSAVGLYFLPSEARAWVRQYIDEDGNPDAPGHFLEWLARRQPLRAAPLEGSWHDIGNLQTLAAARAAYAS